jgi:hypothetical protein
MEIVMPNLLILREFGLLVCVLYCSHQTHAQLLTGAQGAEVWMLGGASSSSTNAWSVCNNPAGLSAVQTTQVGLYTEQRYTISELKTGGITLVKPFKSISTGAALSYYGFSAFNQQRYTFSVSKSLSKVARLGVQGQYVSTFIQDYGSTGNWVLGLGLQVMPIQPITLGLFLFNPTQARYGSHTTERIPTYIRLGCTYLVSDKVKVTLEADQQLEQQLCWRGGIHYRIHEVMYLALGAATRPTYYTFGVGLKVKTFQLDLASSIHEVLGFTPHLGLTIPVQK